MRVKVLENAKIGSKAVFEITDIGYDDDITSVKDENGYYDRYEDKCISGLYMIDANENKLYIEGLGVYECNSICDAILRDGYYDLSSYGEYMFYYDEDEEEEY